MSSPLDSYGELPGVLADAARLGGLQLAASLAHAFGGRRVFVPRGLSRSGKYPFVKGLRAQGATPGDIEALVGVFGGEHIDVPLGPFVGLHAAQGRRREEVRRRLAAGEKRSEIAAACGTTERSVYRIAAETDEDTPPLFRRP